MRLQDTADQEFLMPKILNFASHTYRESNVIPEITQTQA